jgi:hypothetical protein
MGDLVWEGKGGGRGIGCLRFEIGRRGRRWNEEGRKAGRKKRGREG